MCRRHWFLGIIIVFTAVLVFMNSAYAGWLMEEKNGDKSYLSSGKLKIFAESMIIIFHGKTNEMMMADEKKKIYCLATVDEYCAIMKELVDKAMANMPAEYKQMMDQMMGSGKKDSPAPVVSVSKTGTQEKIAGFNTDKYNVIRDGKLYEEVFIAADSALNKDYEPLIPMMKKFSKCASASMSVMSASPEHDPEYQKLMEKGLIVKTVNYESGSPRIDSNVVKVEKKDIPDTEFNVPAGYKKIGLSELIASQMQKEE